MTETELDRPDRAILNAFQGGFPVVEQPFEPAAHALGEAGVDLDATDLRTRIQRLDKSGVLSRFGPLINADAIGGKSTLVAMAVPEARFESVAETVNEYPAVAHNYERDHELNMWFVVSVPDASQIESVLAKIEHETGLETYNLPKQREFYLQATFPVEGPLQEGLDCSSLGPAPKPVECNGLTPREYELIVAVQDGLSHSATPYADVADRIDASTGWVVETLNRFLASGKMRRVGVVPNHYALGYTENAMTVWNVPDSQVEAVGEALGELPFVTHCYERPRHGSLWSYNLFAMVHGVSPEQCGDRIERARETVTANLAGELRAWDTLYSTRILKKTGIRLSQRAREAVTESPKTTNVTDDSKTTDPVDDSVETPAVSGEGDTR